MHKEDDLKEVLSARQVEREIVLKLKSDDPRHEQFATELSVFFARPDVRLLFSEYLSAWGDETVLWADFFYSTILSDGGEGAMLLDDEEAVFNCDFLEDYFYQYPGIEGSFTNFDDTIPPNLTSPGFDFEVFLMFDDTDLALGFSLGEMVGTYDIEEVPVGNVLKVSMGDFIYVSKDVDDAGVNFRPQFSDLFSCPDLVQFVNSRKTDYSSMLNTFSCQSSHPLQGLNVVSQDDLLAAFNESCGNPSGPGLGGGDGPHVDPRSTCDRDRIVNERELIVDVRSTGGRAILRDCDTWCARRDKRCIFQVDVMIPTSSPDDSEFEVFGTIKKVFSTGERRLRKEWRSDGLKDSPLPITEWLYLEGRHGDEWQYSWTGRHRNRGTTVEQNHSISLSNKVGFKKDGLEVSKENKGSSSVKITRANEDCFLGDEISRYCRSLRERLYSGDLYFLVNEQAL